MIAASSSSDFRNQVENTWCVSIGKENGTVYLYEDRWQDKQHYVCQYRRKYGVDEF